MLRPAIIFEDKTIFVSMTPDEFREKLEMWIKSGKSVKEAMDEIVKEIKRATLTK